ncbi:MAG: helix-turn-helix domain-containing protein [Treponemataceae bacterium]|nr:helix-turn-helix domain-containing protein [Treponemataceae bacterium]
MSFAENFRDELSYQQISLKEFSAKTGISENTLKKYRPGCETLPSIDIAQKIASALKVSLDYLATGKSAESEILSPKIMEMAKKMRNLNETEIEAIGKIIDALVQKK